MTRISLNLFEAGAIAIIIYYLGMYIKSKIKFLRDYFIPAPVVGGLVFALLNFALHQAGWVYVTFDSTLQKFFMTMFFTSVGFSARLSFMKKGGRQLFLMAIACAVCIFMQDIIGVAGAILFGKSPFLGISVGSVPLIGGHGTAGAFGPVLEELGGHGSAAASIAMATFGLISGGLVGGPVANRLIRKYGLSGKEKQERKVQDEAVVFLRTNPELLLRGISVLLVAMGAGSVLTNFVGKFGLVLPGYLGGMVVAAIIANNNSDKLGNINYVPFAEIEMLGSMSLQIFLSMALMGLSVWELIELAGPLTAIAVVEVFFICVYAYFVVFRLMGKDYEAAVISSAFCGFGLGATPTAMANMQAITERHGTAPLAFIIVPLTGSLLVDFTNASIITLFINIFK